MRTFIAAIVATVAVGVGMANAEPIEDRKQILKGFADATKPVGAMLKGDAPFQLAQVQAALRAYIDGAKKLPGLFPDDSKTGHDTEALPKIWEDKARFDGLFDKLGKDSEVALAGISDEASLKATFPKLLGNCKSCHDDFRLKK